jgi:hypothetical protein
MRTEAASGASHLAIPHITFFTASKHIHSFTIPFRLACHTATIQVLVGPLGVSTYHYNESEPLQTPVTATDQRGAKKRAMENAGQQMIELVKI